jgi:flagellar basal-body rod protein FlgG
VPTDKSGEPEAVTPDGADRGAVLQGYLEVSNVNMVDEMSNLILAQRAMEVNSRVVQVSQEILGLITDLRK